MEMNRLSYVLLVFFVTSRGQIMLVFKNMELIHFTKVCLLVYYILQFNV